jgi:hypothetical protein
MAGVTRLQIVTVVGLLLFPQASAAQGTTASTAGESARHSGGDPWKFLGGAAIGFGAHELGHVIFDVVFDADPGVKKITFHGIPFFAITHANPLPRRQEYAVAAAGLWTQHATSEWLLSRQPNLRQAGSAVKKGVLAFDVLASVVYSGAAIFRIGPPERDTRAMAAAARVDERWIGVLVLAPALLDTYRYFHPDARWAAWSSRGLKVGTVLLVLK